MAYFETADAAAATWEELVALTKLRRQLGPLSCDQYALLRAALRG